MAHEDVPLLGMIEEPILCLVIILEVLALIGCHLRMILSICLFIRFIHVLVIAHCRIDIDRAGDGRLLIIVTCPGGQRTHALCHAPLRRLSTSAPATPAVTAVAVGIVLGPGTRAFSRRGGQREARIPYEQFDS